MSPTSTVASAVAAAKGDVAGVGTGTTAITRQHQPLASTYRVSSSENLKQYRGRRVQVVGVVLPPPLARAAGGAQETEMQLESVRVVGKCSGK